MQDDAEALARLARDKDDFGRVLKALIATEGEPAEVAETVLNRKLDRTKNKQPLKILLSDYLIPSKAVTASGGGGLVFQCVNRREPKVKYALKIVRPSLLDEEPAEEQQRALGEFVKHAPLSHQNVARVYSAGELIATGARHGRIVLQYMVVEWIDGATPLRSYLASELTPDWQTALRLIIQAFDGLEHLHRAGLVHWDVKSENFLVARGGIPKLSDLGSARQRDRSAEEAATALSTRWNVPFALIGDSLPAETTVSSRRMPIKVPDRNWDAPWLDLWMLARDLNRLFVADKEVRAADDRLMNPQRAIFAQQSNDFLVRCFPEADPDARHAYDLIAIVLRRLLRPKTPGAARFYDHANDVIHDLNKLKQPLGAAFRVRELGIVPQRVMRIPVWNNIPYTERFGALFNSVLLKRLNKHLQLGALVQVYPGASHRRSEHSAGVFAATCEYVRALYADRRDPFWRLSIEERDIDALLLAALAHDIGHLSFGHFLEEMKGLFGNRRHEDYAAAVLAPVPPRGAAEVLISDRKLLRDIVEKMWSPAVDAQDLLSDALTILRGVNATSDLLNEDSVLSQKANRALKFDILHTILDSAIDADKLDYLARDAHHCNVQYSKGVDIDRFLQSLTTLSYVDHKTLKTLKEHRSEEDSVLAAGDEDERSPETAVQAHACIGITEKGVAPVESILIARYHMFSAVYWQHTARALTVMLQFVVQEFVGLDAKHWNERLSSVIDEFRQREDIDALQWLLSRVRDSSKVKNAKSREVLESMCAGLLGERDQVHWPAFELRYGRSKEAAKLSVGLMRRADSLHTAANGFDYVERCREFRQEVASHLSANLDGRVTFGLGDLLVDVPPGGRDQIDNIFVIADGATRPIQDVSPVADAVRDSFRFWVRKARVFLSPTAWAACSRAGISEEELHRASWNALHSSLQPKEQQELSFRSESTVKRDKSGRTATRQ
jgi:HD superfamily phosphohydrolase